MENDLTLLRAHAGNPDFRALTALLDAELAERNGSVQALYQSHNRIDPDVKALIALSGQQAVACGAFKEGSGRQVEIKRMFVLPAFRGQGLSRRVLAGLEAWAAQLGYLRAVLETGTRQVEAQQLYASAGYQRIEAYGPYADLPDSLCYAKDLRPA